MTKIFMKALVDQFKWSRFHDNWGWRWFYVYIFVSNTFLTITDVYHHNVTWVTYVALVFAVLYAYMAWPTMIGQAGKWEKAEDDTTSNS